MKWYQAAPRFFEQEKEALFQQYPLLKMDIADGTAIAEGILHFSADYQGKLLSDKYFIKIIFPDSYPDDYPRVIEKGSRIKPEYHTMPDETLCLETPLNQMIIFRQSPTIIGFVNKLLVPYLYRHSYIQKYKSEPFEDRKHGVDGIIQQYSELLNTSDIGVITKLLRVVTSERYVRGSPCPCQSGKTLEQCHGPRLLGLKRDGGKYFLHEAGALVAYAPGRLQTLRGKTLHTPAGNPDIEIMRSPTRISKAIGVTRMMQDVSPRLSRRPGQWQDAFKRIVTDKETGRTHL